MAIKENTNTTIRNTKQKTLILNCLRENRLKHLTADEIIEMLKQRKTPVARATVYRYLSALEESGDVLKYNIHDATCACYHFIGDKDECHEHYHMLCLDCTKVIHFENKELKELFENNFFSEDFVIEGTKTVFYGKCKKCILSNKS